MAESWTIAFGRYLRTLRERRGLSLDEVESLSEAFPDPIRKAYLSKCENGHQSPAFSKLVALCRIYEVPAEVLVERLQLDMELEKTDAPSTANREFNELVDAGFEALQRGFGWHAYACLRDATRLAETAPIRDKYIGREEQVLVAQMYCATGALRLGRLRFPLHECSQVSESVNLSPTYSAIAAERVAQCHRRLGDLDEAKRYIHQAIGIARDHNDNYALGYCLAGRALIGIDEAQYDVASTCFEEAYSCFRENGLRHECARTLANLAQCYFYMDRLRAAQRAATESLRIADELDLKRSKGLIKILLGEIHLREGRTRSAIECLRDAAAIAEAIDDKVLWFKAEFQIFRYVRNSGSSIEVRRLRNQLSKLKAWIPTDTPELAEFANLRD